MNTFHRFPHGATRGPGLERPLSGYGRPAGRPGPPARLAPRSAAQSAVQSGAQSAAQLVAPSESPRPAGGATARRGLVHRLFVRRLAAPGPEVAEGWSLSS